MSAPATLRQTRKLLDLFGDEPTVEQVQNLLANGDLLKHMMQADLSKVDRQAFMALFAPPTSELFNSPEQILSSFIDRAQERKWPITAAQLERLGKTMPEDHVSTLSGVLTLDIWLGDLPTTFEELWSWLQQVYPNHWRYDGLKSGKKQLRLLKPQSYGTVSSVHWVTVDLTANRNTCPMDIRDNNSAGLELLSIAVLHPEWPKAIDYDTIPGVWLGGLEATIPGEGAWRCLPILSWGDANCKVLLNAYRNDARYSDCTVPEVREL